MAGLNTKRSKVTFAQDVFVTAVVVHEESARRKRKKYLILQNSVECFESSMDLDYENRANPC